MIQYLTRIIEYRAGGSLGDYLFQRHILELAAGQQFVQVIYVCLQVLAVVEREGLSADDRLESIKLVWEFDECFH